MKIISELWFCDDCTIVAVNGDTSGISDPERLAAVEAGLERVGLVCAHWDTETEFSWRGCDCCRSPLGGSLHRFAVLGDE